MASCIALSFSDVVFRLRLNIAQPRCRGKLRPRQFSTIQQLIYGKVGESSTLVAVGLRNRESPTKHTYTVMLPNSASARQALESTLHGLFHVGAVGLVKVSVRSTQR